jgi:hypothetical protein
MTHLGILIALALSTALPRPPSGVAVNETRTVPALPAAPRICFAYTGAGGNLLVEGTRIRQAAASPTATWETEAERLAYVYAKRARELVATSAPESDPHGCKLLSPSVSMDALSLLVEEAEAGRAAATDSQGRFSPAIAILYSGAPCGVHCGLGMITVSLPGGQKPLVEVLWWQA